MNGNASLPYIIVMNESCGHYRCLNGYIWCRCRLVLMLFRVGKLIANEKQAHQLRGGFHTILSIYDCIAVLYERIIKITPFRSIENVNWDDE